VGSVVISANTYEQIRDRAVVRRLGIPELKGKSQAVEVYQLVDLRPTAGADRGTVEMLP
jgi:class 3 adenylate cyclase